MPFRCDSATLQRLEWHRLAECLAGCCASSRGMQAARGTLFQPTRASVVDRIAETSEARKLVDAAEPLPFGGVHDLRTLLEEIERGRVPAAADFHALHTTLDAAHRVRRFLAERSERAPHLADLAHTLPQLTRLSQKIAAVVSETGEVRDDASPALRKLSRRVRELEGEINRRMAACLRDPALQPHLQDSYVTTRETRPVLPVRADARSRVNGIVHDVSSSGTTVFIEPQSVVEAGNRLRVAQTERIREIERLLRELAEAVSEDRGAIDATGATLEALDLANARGRLSARLDAAAPELCDDGVLDLRELRHPLLLLETELAHDEVIANDIHLPEAARGLVISGPNAGGKTVAAKAIGLAALAVRAGLHVPCTGESRMSVVDAVFADIGDDQDLRSGLSTFSARMATLARVIDAADPRTLVIVDEIGEGTEPGEGAALAQAVLEGLVARGALVVATTHFNRLKELAGSDERFFNASAEFDPETLLPTYRIHMGAPGSSGATWVAERMGLARTVVERAQDLLDNEDRKLEALTRGLSELRQELEAERQATSETRVQTQAAREAYESRLEQLRAAREEALAAMKGELEDAFTSARAELAAVMRTVQKGGQADGRAASRAYNRLEALEERTAEVEQTHAPEPEPIRAIDWPGVEIGARLEIEGIRGEATLLEPPDRRERIVVRVGGTRTELPAARVRRVLGAAPAPKHRAPVAHIDVDRAPAPEEMTPECDLRGLRVDEALDRAEAHLHKVLGRGVARVRFIHGHGTGALRGAIRSWLKSLPEVASFAPGGDHEGGNGVTVATLSD
jgi:DNA mismatch repair protein MutS2